MVCAASNSGPLVCTRHVFGAGTIGKIFISDAHKERGGSAVFSFVVHRTIAAGGRSKLVDPRSCAGGTRRRDRCDGIATLTFAASIARRAPVCETLAFWPPCCSRDQCSPFVPSWKFPPVGAAPATGAGTAYPHVTAQRAGLSGRHRHGILVWTSGRGFSSSRLESARRCPMCGSRAAGPLVPERQGAFGALRCSARMVEVPNPAKFLG